MVDRPPGSHQQIAEISLGNDQGRCEFAAGSGKREGQKGWPWDLAVSDRGKRDRSNLKEDPIAGAADVPHQ